ncbi:MAG: hypothetical protein JXJ20_10140 [Anaerolineae bacterium]|jgi:putative FmdB family regulatory protein|nr:hypothetical protein [Anaerolineae bacterium]
MPTYEFRCNDCGHKVTLKYKTYAAYDEATPTCTHCGSADLTRLISRVAIKRSMLSGIMSGDLEDNDALSALDNADPATLGRVLREMSAEVGEDMGDEFDEVIGRMERGERPEDIEASLPPDSEFASPPAGDDLI